MKKAEIRTFRYYVSEVTGEDRIRNEYERRSISVASIVDKIKKNRPRWFEHIMKKNNELQE